MAPKKFHLGWFMTATVDDWNQTFSANGNPWDGEFFVDMAKAMDVSVEDLASDVHKLKPDIKVIPTSCKTGEGIEKVAAALLAV